MNVPVAVTIPVTPFFCVKNEHWRTKHFILLVHIMKLTDNLTRNGEHTTYIYIYIHFIQLHYQNTKLHYTCIIPIILLFYPQANLIPYETVRSKRCTTSTLRFSAYRALAAASSNNFYLRYFFDLLNPKVICALIFTYVGVRPNPGLFSWS